MGGRGPCQLCTYPASWVLGQSQVTQPSYGKLKPTPEGTNPTLALNRSQGQERCRWYWVLQPCPSQGCSLCGCESAAGHGRYREGHESKKQ